MTGRVCFLAAVPLCAAMQLFSQPMPELTIRGGETTRTASLPVLRADVNLVQVSAVVTDRSGATVNGLTPGHFTVTEDGIERPIVSFAMQDAACSLGIILDRSGSMRETLAVANAAVRAVLETAGPQDESFLLTVGTRPESLSGFTDDVSLLESHLSFAKAEGSTALIDTIYLGLSRIRASRKGCKALLIVSDGIDNNSRYSKAELLRTVQEADVQIYTIGVAADPAGKKPIELLESSVGLCLLNDLASRSGGLNFIAVVPDDVPAAATRISRALREEYLIGYLHQDAADSGKWRSIQVKVNAPELRVHARTGYYTP